MVGTRAGPPEVSKPPFGSPPQNTSIRVSLIPAKLTREGFFGCDPFEHGDVAGEFAGIRRER